MSGTASRAAAAEEAQGHEVRRVSVLFVDLEGFTTLSESRDAEDVRELLSQYFETAKRVVDRYDGTVEKFIGDAVMAVWGSPVAREDDAERAVRAGLDMIDAVAGLAETTGIPTLRARAGVVTGQAASWGGGGEALVVGDRVNTAARIQALAEPGTVLVDDVTRQASLASIAYADAGEHSLKGKAESVHVWHAQRVVAGALGHDRVDGLEARFVGRDSELRLVKDMFHSSAERSQARLALVVGPAGSGKSRLLAEFSRYSDGLASDVFWHVGRCLSYGEGVAFWALAEAVRQRLGIAEDATESDADRLLDAGIAAYVPDLDEASYLRPRLAALLGLPGGEGLDRQDLMTGWRTFFQRLAERDPVVIVLEDLQWADTALLDFIDHLLEWASHAPIFVLGLGRPELLERRTNWVAGRRNLTVLWLDRLPDQAVGELLDDLVPAMPGPVRTRIVAQAEGVPLYAVESVRSLVDRGLVVAQGGRYVLVGEVGELDVPPSLTSLLASRLDGLEPEPRAVAMRMSVFLGGFSRDAVVAVAETPNDRVDDVLSDLVRREVLAVRSDRLSPDRGQYLFAQTLLRQVAYDMLGKRERKARHLGAAEHLRVAYADGADVDEVLASHYRGAYEAVPEDPDAGEIRRLAFDSYLMAAERALTVGAPDLAEHAFSTAATLTDGPERIDVIIRAADAAVQAGRVDRAYGHVKPILADDATVTPRQWADASLVACRVYGLEGRLQEQITTSGTIIERFAEPDEDDVPVVVRALLSHSGAQVFSGSAGHTGELVERALMLSESIGDVELVSECLMNRGLLLTLQDRPLEAFVAFEGALRYAADTQLLQLVRNNIGDLAMQVDSDEAGVHFEAALDLARRRGSRVAESMAILNLAQINMLHGEWTHARSRVADALSALEESGYGPERQTLMRVMLAILARFRGDEQGLRSELMAIGPDLHSEDPWEVGLHDWLTLELRAMEGDDVAEALADQAEASLSLGLRTEWFRYVWVDALARASAAGRDDLLQRLLPMVADRPQGNVPPFLRAQLARYQGIDALRSGDSALAAKLVRRAVDDLDSLGYPYWAAVTRLDLAEILRQRGQPDEAGRCEDAARDTLQSLGVLADQVRSHTQARPRQAEVQ